jgi:hypothetical protein
MVVNQALARLISREAARLTVDTSLFAIEERQVRVSTLQRHLGVRTRLNRTWMLVG